MRGYAENSEGSKWRIFGRDKEGGRKHHQDEQVCEQGRQIRVDTTDGHVGVAERDVGEGFQGLCMTGVNNLILKRLKDE